MFTATRCYAGYKWSGLNNKGKRRLLPALILFYKNSFRKKFIRYIIGIDDLVKFLGDIKPLKKVKIK